MRLTFIDALRLFAIIMMLQGHFVHLTLDTTSFDNEHWLFKSWLFCRGNTAPLFFSISGFILTYILLQKNRPELKVIYRKNVKRGILLICIGYLLRLHLGSVFTGNINQSLLQVDVLHCIGLAIIILSTLIFQLSNLNSNTVKSFILFGTCFFIFLIDPIRSNILFSSGFQFFSNYFTQQFGSVFTLFPWLGYAFFGAGLSVIWQNQLVSQHAKTGLLLIFGWLFVNSSPFFMSMFRVTDYLLFKQVAYNNYLFIRLGYVLIIMAVFNGISAQTKLIKPLQLLSKNTLTIYVIHFIILYGSWFRLGIKQVFQHNLPPFWSAIGAVFFVLICCGASLSYIKTKPYITQRYYQYKFMLYRRIVQRRMTVS